MSKYLYKSDDKRITFYPQLELISFAMVLGGILLLCLALFIFSINSTAITLAIIGGSAIFPITCILLIFARSTQVIIDIESKKIIKKTLMAEKEIATFNDVEDIELILDNRKNWISCSRYIININKAPYVIMLTHPLRTNAKNFKTLTSEAINKAKTILHNEQIKDIDTTNINNQLFYFKSSRRDCYYYKARKKNDIIICFLFCIVIIPIAYTRHSLFMSTASIIFIVLFLSALFSKTIEIDTNNQTISLSKRKIYPFKMIEKIEIAQRSDSYNNSVIKIEIDKDRKIIDELFYTETSQAKTLGILKEISVLTGIPIKKD